MTDFSLAYFLGALGFFLYGLRLSGEALNKASGDELRNLIGRFTENRMAGFSLGVLTALVFQSSTAAVIMLVGLCSVEFLTVRRALPSVLGADVGTTVLVFALATFVRFDFLKISLGFMAFALFSRLFFKTRSRFLTRAVLGIAFVFYGLSLMRLASDPVRNSPLFAEVVAAISQNVLVAVALSAVLTGVLQSSAAILGILLSLSAAGIVSAGQAVPFVLGANLGTALGPLLVGQASRAQGKRLAYLHLGVKSAGVLAFLPAAAFAGRWLENSVSEPSYQIAVFHMIFNGTLAAAFLPITGFLARWSERVVTSDDKERKFGAMYLDEHALNSPTMAFANMFREILRMAEITQEMCKRALDPFRANLRENVDKLEEMDDKVDALNREIKLYMARLSEEQLTKPQSEREVSLLMLTQDLESLGDAIVKDLVELAEKKHRLQLEFSEQGWSEICDFHDKVCENFDIALTSLVSGDVELARKVLRHKKHVAHMEQDLAQRHLHRLRQGLPESVDTSSIHLEALATLRRINSMITKLAYPVLERHEAKASGR